MPTFGQARCRFFVSRAPMPTESSEASPELWSFGQARCRFFVSPAPVPIEIFTAGMIGPSVFGQARPRPGLATCRCAVWLGFVQGEAPYTPPFGFGIVTPDSPP